MASSAATTSAAPRDDNVNARVIGRKDPFFAEIIDSVGIVSVYNYVPSLGEYVKQPAMGPLFLIRRTKAPEYALYMINRSGVKNQFWGLYPTEMRIKAHDEDKLLEVARRGEPERPRFWFSDATPLRRLFDRINSIVGPPIKPGDQATTNTAAPSSAQPPQAPAQVAPQQTTAPSQPTQQPDPDDHLAHLFAGLATLPAPNATTPAHVPQSQPHHTAVQPPVHSYYPQHPPQNPHHYTTNVAPFVGPQAPYSHYSTSPAPGHSDSSTPQPPHPPPPPMSTAAFSPHETADGLFKSLLGGGAPSFPYIPHPPAHGISTAGPVPPRTTVSPVRGPHSMGHVPQTTQRGFPGHRGDGSGGGGVGDGGTGGRTNVNVSPPRNHQQAPFPGQQPRPAVPGNPSPDGMRDALVSTYAPNNGQAQYHQMPKERLVGTMIHLLQTNPAFGDDVWRAYMARCVGGPGH